MIAAGVFDAAIAAAEQALFDRVLDRLAPLIAAEVQRRVTAELADIKESPAKADDEAAVQGCGAAESVSRPDAGRSASATTDRMGVTAGETASHHELLGEIEAFLARTGMAESRFGKDAMHDIAFVRSLRKGRQPGVMLCERARRFMREHKVPNAVIPKSDSAIGLEEAAAEVTSGLVTDPDAPPANIDQSRLVARAPRAAPSPPLDDDDDDASAALALAIEKVQDRPVELRPAAPIDTTRLAAAFEREAKSKVPLTSPTRIPRYTGMRWCDQCARRVAWAQAESCKSSFCKVEA